MANYNPRPWKRPKTDPPYADATDQTKRDFLKDNKELTNYIFIDEYGNKREPITKNLMNGWWYKRPLPRIPLEFVPLELRYPGVEIKSIDSAFGGLAIGNNNQANLILNQMTNVVLGSDIQNRIGRKVNICSVEGRVGFNMLSGPVAPKPLRMVLVYDLQFNAIPITSWPTYLTGAGASPPYQGYNVNNRLRFITLYDSGPFFLGPYNGTMAWNTSWATEFFVECFIPTIWNSTGGVTTGELTLLLLADDTTAATNCSATGTIRVSFIDA